MSATMRGQADAVNPTDEAAVTAAGTDDTTARTYRWWQRALAGAVALTLFVGPLSVTYQQGQSAARELAAGHHGIDDATLEFLHDLAAVRVSFEMRAAAAAPIVDPTTPIVFQPKVTTSGNGVPVVNITAPNAAGLSLNQYQTFNIDAAGLILNNSLTAGTSLNGGAVGANPNLTGRQASVIINQVTSTGAAYASVLNGPLEVFGAPATVVIANPNGIAVQGAGFTNTIGVTLTTGAPQFLTAPGGTATSFANAQALAYNVTSGHIQLEGNAGVTGPGSGIEGTVGAIDLIGQTVGVNAPLYAGTRINVIAGDQLVSAASVDGTGTTYTTTPNGSANTAQAIQSATQNSQAVAIDATQFGAMTAGQIAVIGTTAGLGVKLAGDLAATTGNLMLSSSGDLTVANHAAQQEVQITSGGNVAVTGNGLAETAYRLSATGDVVATGTVQSAGTVDATADGSLNFTSLQANGNATLLASKALTLGAASIGGDLTLTTQGIGATNILLDGPITVGGALAANAARDMLVNATTGANGSVALTAGGNIAVAQGTQLTSQTSVVLAAGGDVRVAGTVASGTTLDMTAGGKIDVSGDVAATGSATLNAGSAINVDGTLLAQADGKLAAGTDITGAGKLAFGTAATLFGSRDITLTGALLAGSLEVTAGNSLSVTDLQSTDAAILTANGQAGGGDVALLGNVAFYGAATVQAARDVLIAGSAAGANAMQVNAARDVSVTGSLQTAGTTQDLTITAGNDASVAGTVATSGGLKATTGGALSIVGTTASMGDVDLQAGSDLSITGTLSGQGAGALSANRAADVAGSASFLGDLKSTSGTDTSVSGSIQGNNVSVMAGNSATLKDVVANDSLNVTAQGQSGGGDVALTGNVASFGAATVTAARDATLSGTIGGNDTVTITAQRAVQIGGTGISAIGDVRANAVNGALTTSADISTNANLALSAGQSITLSGAQTSAIGNATVVAGQDVTLNGALVALNGTMSAGQDVSGAGAAAFTGTASVAAARDVNLSGVLQGNSVAVTAGNSAAVASITSNGALDITAKGTAGGGDVTLNGSSSVVGTVTVDAARDASVVGQVAGGADVALTGARDVNVSGTLQSAGGTALTATQGNVNTTGALGAGGMLTATAGTDVSLGGTASVTGDTVVTAARDLLIVGTMNGQGGATLSAGRDVLGSGTVAVTQTLTASAGRDVTQGGLLQGGGLSITAGNNLSVDNAESTKSLTLTANGNAGEGDITVNGAAAATGSTTLTAARDVSIAGTVGSGTTTTIDATRNIGIAGAIQSVGDATLTARTGSLSATGGISGGANLSLNAAQDVLLGASTTALGDVTATAGRDLQLGAVLVGTVGQLNAGRTLLDATDGTSKAVFTGSATLDSAGDIALAGTVQANGIVARADGNATVGSLNSTSTVAISTTGTAGAGDITINGAVSSPDAFTAVAARDLALNGSLACGAQCDLTAARNLRIAGTAVTVGDLSLTTLAGDASITGDVTTGGTLRMTSQGDATLGGVLNVQGDLIANAVRAMNLTGNASVQGNGTLTAGTDIGGAGTLALGGDALLNAARDTTLTGGLSAQTVTVTAANSAGLGSVQATKTLTIVANGQSGGGDITASGDVVALDTLKLTAQRDISVTGKTAGGTNVVLTAGAGGAGDITLTGDTIAQGDLTISAVSGGVTAGNVGVQGLLSVVSGGPMALTGTVSSNGDMALTSGGDMTLGQVNGMSANASAGLIKAGGSLTSGSLTFGNGGLTITSGGSTNVAGAVVAGTELAANAAGNLSLGSAQAGQGIAMTATGTQGGAGDVTVGGAIQAGKSVSLTAARDASIGGATTAGDGIQAQAGRNLSMGALSANQDITLASTSGDLAINGAVTAIANLTATAGGALATAGGQTNGNLALTSGSTTTINGQWVGSGTATVNSAGDLSGAGGLTFQKDVTVTSGGGASLDAGIDTAGNASVMAQGDVSLGELTAIGNAALTSRTGSMTLGNTLVGGTLNATVAKNLTAVSGIASIGAMTLTATQGDLSAAGVSSNATATLTASGTTSLAGANSVAGDLTLKGNDVVVAGATTASSNFVVDATRSIDSSAGQVYVTKDALLSAPSIASGSMIVGGSLTETASQSITTNGMTLVTGNATFDAGLGTVTNAANSALLSGGALSISGSSIVNGAGGSIASTGALSLTSTGDVSNSGVLNGLTTSITAGGTLINNGGTILGTNGVSLNLGNLNNNGGLVMAGNVTQTASAAPAALSLAVTGTGTVTNANGELAATNDLTMLMASASFDASDGSLQAGGTLSLTVNNITNSGNWQISAANALINGVSSFTNSGTIQSDGALTLGSNGVLANTGSIIGAGAVTINADLLNGVGATIHSDTDLSLTGAVINSGTLEALNDLTATGASFNNVAGTVKAGRNITFTLPGDLNNTAGTIIAGNNITVTANAIHNDQALGNGAVTTTTTITDPTLLWSGAIGTKLWYVRHTADNEGSAVTDSYVGSATLGDLLSPTGYSTAGRAAGMDALTGDRCGVRDFTCNSGASSPIVGSGAFYLNEFWGSRSDGNGGSISYLYWRSSTSPSGVVSNALITLPTVYQTSTTMDTGNPGVMIAGGNVSLTASSLSNKGGQIGAGGNVSLNVDSLSNGAVAPTTTYQAVNWVDQTEYTAFLRQLASVGSIQVPDLYDPNTSWYSDTGMPAMTFTINTSSVAPTSTSSITWSTPVGLITAAGDLNLSGGALINEGMLYAQNNVNISATSVTNQGGNTQSYTTTAGCAAGTSNLACYRGNDVRGENPDTTSFTYAQNNAAIIAGNDLTIAAGSIANTYGDLIAGHDLVIGGVGSSATSTTPASTLTNTSGNILAGNNLTLNVSGSITNTLPAPVQVHENYGRLEAYAGCMTAGGYRESYCEAYVDQQSGNSSIISAGNSLSIDAGSLTNVGSLITAGTSATINVAGPVVNSAQVLNAYWHSHWVQETSLFSEDKRHEIWSCGSAAECTALYGDAYTSVGGVIDPPTPVGNIAATIQAPNLTVTSSGQIVNVGNVIGQSVSLTGTSLVNGITTANTYTPQVSNPPQVISLAPANGGLNLTIPASLGGSGSSILTGTTSAAGSATYVVGGLSATIDPVSPEVLLSNLPASLQPSSTLFYYSPAQETIQLQQAALLQTGQATFINGLSTDSTSQLTVSDQQKLVLYGNAVNYATANNIQLGQALTQDEIAGLTQPMLWYVEQSVPEPGCAATGSAQCPTVQALVPQIYLPENFTALSAGGQILASNDLSLNFGTTASGGSVLNTGAITSAGSLTVNTGTLTNQANVVDIGEIWSYIAGAGYMKTSGTVVQPGGFMTAAAGELTLNVDQMNQIGGALQLMDASGRIDGAATQQFVAGIMAQLGDNYTQQTLADDLHTDFVKEGGSFGAQQLGMVMMAAITMMVGAGISAGLAAAETAAEQAAFEAAMASIASGEAASSAAIELAASELYGGLLSSGLFAAGTVGNAAASAFLTSAFSSSVGQLMTNGTLNLGDVLLASTASALTVGLTKGITYNATDGFGISNTIGSDNLSSIAGSGVSTIPGTASNAFASTASRWAEQGLAIAGESAIQAGVQTAIQGGSFLDAFQSSAISNLGAVGAYQIGELGTNTLGQLGYLAAHAALGCVGSAAMGAGCEGGAIGGALSAALTPDFIKAIDPTGAPLTSAQLAGLALLANYSGAIVAGVSGADAASGAFWAQNQALNNDAASLWHIKQAARGGLLAVLASFIPGLPGSPLQLAGRDFGQILKANNGKTPPSDANPLVNGDNGGPFGTGAVPASPGGILCEGVICMWVPGSPAVPANVMLSTGDGSGGSSAKGDSSDESSSLGSDVRLYPDGSIRTPDGKFASASGSSAPGTAAASQFADFLKSNGVNVVGEEVSVNGPLGVRRYDIVTMDAAGNLHGIEVKSGSATPTAYQRLSDFYVNKFGADAIGRFSGQRVSSATTVYVP